MSPLPPQDWRARVDMAVALSQRDKIEWGGRNKAVVGFRTSAMHILRAAADKRGVSVAAFVRRAALSMAAAVLEMPYAQAIEADPTIQVNVGSQPTADPTGELFGPWEISGLQ